jgi:DNA-binding NarL/FixJ family response regulator
MYLAEKTVKNYVSSLLHKLGFARPTTQPPEATDRRLRHPSDNAVSN